jgi:hypothetical protein
MYWYRLQIKWDYEKENLCEIPKAYMVSYVHCVCGGLLGFAHVSLVLQETLRLAGPWHLNQYPSLQFPILHIRL